MSKKTLRTTVSQMDSSLPLQGQPARDTAALILPLSALKLGPNIRTDLGDLSELVASIKEHGLLQPLVVAKTARGLELVAGFRRYHAAKEAGMVEVPVRIVGADENQVALLRLVENIMRENLSGADEIAAVAKLLPIFPDQKTLASAISKSPSYVARCCQAAKIIADPDCACAIGGLSKSALFELADARDPKALLKEMGSGANREAIRNAKAVESQTTAARASSGAIAGGRYGAEGCLTFNERRGGKAFSLRLNVDFEQTPPGTIEKAIGQLEQILAKLKQIGK